MVSVPIGLVLLVALVSYGIPVLAAVVLAWYTVRSRRANSMWFTLPVYLGIYIIANLCSPDTDELKQWPLLYLVLDIGNGVVLYGGFWLLLWLGIRTTHRRKPQRGFEVLPKR